MSRFNNNNNPPPNNGGNGGGKPPAAPGSLKLPVIHEPRCLVCKSDYRTAIDKLLMVGVPAGRIAEDFSNEGLTRKSVSNHRMKHISIQDRAIRQIIEDEAHREMMDVDETKRFLITTQAYMETALVKGFQAIVDEKITPEPRDVIQMINLMHKEKERTAAKEKEELMREFNAFARAVQEMVPKNIWNDVNNRFDEILAVEDNVITQYGMEIHDLQGLLPSAEFPTGD